MIIDSITVSNDPSRGKKHNLAIFHRFFHKLNYEYLTTLLHW